MDPILPDDFAEPEVGRPEVVRPLRDAVRLVHAHERDGRQVADQRGEHGAAWKNDTVRVRSSTDLIDSLIKNQR